VFPSDSALSDLAKKFATPADIDDYTKCFKNYQLKSTLVTPNLKDLGDWKSWHSSSGKDKTAKLELVSNDDTNCTSSKWVKNL